MLFSSILILIVAKALPLFSRRISSIHFTRISAIILLLSGILSFNIYYIQSIGSGIGIYSGLFQITNISQTIEFFLLIIGLLILVGWPIYSAYPKNEMSEKQRRLLPNGRWPEAVDYSIIILFSTLGSSLLVSSVDLISIYLSIELQSFGLYILTTLYRKNTTHGIYASNAGLKYFLLGGLSSAIILLGSGIIYSYTGLTQLESIFTLLSTISAMGYLEIAIGTILGIVLIVIGLLFKIAAAPLHNWSPDVYDEAPTIVTIWLTIMPKISILILLLEINLLLGNDPSILSESILNDYWLNNIYYILTNNVNYYLSLDFPLGESAIDEFNMFFIFYNIIISLASTEILLRNILLISSVASLIIGTVVGLAQIKIKRLLAYSTISHIGFMLLALVINTEQSIDSFLFYLIQYILTNLNIFLIILAMNYSLKLYPIKYSAQNLDELLEDNDNYIINIRYIKDLQGLFFNNPMLSLTFSISLFSMAGIPPLMGFFSKQFVLNSAIDQEYYFISILAIIVSVISASYYLKIIKLLHIQTPNDNKFVLERANLIKKVYPSYLSNSHSFIISSLSLIILLFILKPTLILSSTQVLSLTLFNI